MGIVTSITIISIGLFIPLGIAKGFIQKKLFRKESLHYPIVANIILHFVGMCIFCIGGYHFSRANLIGYNYSGAVNILLGSAAGIFLFYSDLILTQHLVRKSPGCANKVNTCFCIFWWCVYTGVFLSPLFIEKKLSPIVDSGTTCVDQICLGKLSSSRIESFFRNKELTVFSYPYGGIIIVWGERKRVFNFQTFFYRWNAARFYFDHVAGIIVFKVDRNIFLYDIEADVIYNRDR